jgi:hypothetical protein
MTKTLLALGAAAVALSAAPADAQYRHHARQCAKWRHGHCVRWMNRGYSRSAYRVGYRFGPDYSYTSYNALPRTYVRHYGLRPNYRYVYRDNRVYVVDPTTYAVTRILDSVTR